MRPSSLHLAIAIGVGAGVTSRSYRLVALPTTVFIDSAGTIRTVHSGPISDRQLAEGIATILPEKRPAK